MAASTSMVFRFGAPMGRMEQYFDLHVGSPRQANHADELPGNGDRTILTCTPHGPLAPYHTYVMHLGGGMATHGRSLR